jgi:hypothetical protein
VTGINGYLGAPAIAGADSGDMDNALLEQNPLATGFAIFEAIDTVIANYLYPYVFDIVSAVITTPDLAHYTEAVAAETEEIISAFQIIGGREYYVDNSRQPFDVHTSVASTGRLARFNWIDGSTGYYTYRAKLLEADEADTELTHLIALGAAAILLGASLSATAQEAAKKDNIESVQGRPAIANQVMRDFLTLRQNMSEELTRRLPQRIYVNRG